jgi:hypothetical protein
MSAFICSDAHIKALSAVAATRVHGRFAVDPLYLVGLDGSRGFTDVPPTLDYELATVYANILLQENIRSVNYRYPSEPSASYSIALNSGDMLRKQSHISLLKLVNCLEYQMSESPDCELTLAFALTRAIRDAIIHDMPGYESAPWTI